MSTIFGFKQNKSIPFIMLLIVATLMMGHLSTQIAFALFLLYIISFLNRTEVCIICLLVLCKVFGFFAPILGISIPGTMIVIILVVILLNKNLFNLWNCYTIVPLYYAISTLILFGIMFLFTANSPESVDKMYRMALSLPIDFLCYSILVSNKNINPERLSIAFLLSSVFWIAFTIDVSPLSSPTGLFDFNFVRVTNMQLQKLNLASVSYHTIGILSFTALSYFLSTHQVTISSFRIIVVCLSFYLMLVSGARQTIFGSVVLVFIWMLIKNQKFKIYRIVLALLLVCFLYYTLQALDIEYFRTFFDSEVSGSSKINRNFDYPIQIFLQNPLLGIGFGNFRNPFTDEIYPHNIFLELLCEFGVLGTLLLLLPLILFMSKKEFTLLKRLPNGSFALLLFVPIFIRSIISSDLGENISMFNAVYFLFYRHYMYIKEKK